MPFMCNYYIIINTDLENKPFNYSPTTGTLQEISIADDQARFLTVFFPIHLSAISFNHPPRSI